MSSRAGSVTNSRYHVSAWQLAFSVALFLFAVYLLTYRGGFHSIDEVSTFAVTESLVKLGRLNTDQIAWSQWTTTQAEAQGFFGEDGHVYSKKGLAISLFQAPLYALALAIPGLGMLQTVTLLNAILTAATAALLVLYLLRLGFSGKTALGAALFFGLTTLVWVYARYLFSGTLAGFLLLLAAWLLLIFKQTGGHWRLLLAGFFAGLTVLARANNLLLLGVLGIYLLLLQATPPPPMQVALSLPPKANLGYLRQTWQRALAAVFWFALGGLVAGFILLWYNWARSGNPLQTGYDLSLFTPNILLGLYKLLFSPLRGLFVYSPILILALPGWFLLRRRHPDEGWLILGLAGVTVLLFSAWSSGEGLSWGSRFLVPLVPFLIIAAAPTFEKAFTNRGWAVVVGVLAFISLAIQILGVSINPWVHLARLQRDFGGEFFLERTSALYDFSTSQLVGQLQQWHITNSDLVWWQPWGFDGLALAFSLVLVMLTALLLVQSWRGKASWWLNVGVGLIVFGATVWLLQRYYQTDLQFGLPDNPYPVALNQLETQRAPGDAVLTVAETDYHVAMNRFKGRASLIGFARSLEPLPQTAIPLLANTLNDRAKNIWLITARYQPADPTVRVEQWLANNAFKATDDWIPDTTNLNLRLVRYGIPQAAGDDETVNAQFDEALTLLTQSRPRQLPPGEVLPVTLRWQTSQPQTENYIIFLQLIDAAGALVAQHDGPPQGGYLPTSQWPLHTPVSDNHGLLLPTELSTGDYRLIAGMYTPVDGRRLTLADGKDFVDLGIVTVAYD